MIVAVDIGNTSISFGVLDDKKVKSSYSVDIHSKRLQLRGQINACIQKILRKHKNVSDIVLCSVVPSLTKVVKSESKKVFTGKIRIVGEDLTIPIENNYDIPAQVGKDRLVGAYAAKVLYGSPAIIIDFGTAITFDVVSAKGEYEGGIIVPGVRLSTEALFTKTALLPLVKRLNPPNSLIGKNTRDSILSGVYYGYGEMCKGLIERISKDFSKKPTVIVTGGFTHSMKKFISLHIDHINTDLVFIGMALMVKNVK